MSYALVKWTAGNDRGLYTVLLTKWVQQFDAIQFKRRGGIRKSYFVEWRESETMPSGGWPVYKGNVIEISESKIKLYCLLEDMSFIHDSEVADVKGNLQVQGDSSYEQSDLESDCSLKRKFESCVQKDMTFLINENKKLRLECCALKAENALLRSGSVKEIPTLLARVGKLMEKLDNEAVRSHSERAIRLLKTRPTPQPISPSSTISTVLAKTTKSVSSSSSLSEMSPSFGGRLPKIPSDVTVTLVSEMSSDLSPPPSEIAAASSEDLGSDKSQVSGCSRKSIASEISVSTFPAAMSPLEKKSSSSSLVELHEDTGIMVDSAALLMARKSTSFYGFVNALLTQLFPMDVLLKSSFRGKKSFGHQNWEIRPALNEDITAVFFQAARMSFPNLPMKSFGMAVNSRLNRLRQLDRDCLNVSGRSQSRKSAKIKRLPKII